MIALQQTNADCTLQLSPQVFFTPRATSKVKESPCLAVTYRKYNIYIILITIHNVILLSHIKKYGPKTKPIIFPDIVTSKYGAFRVWLHLKTCRLHLNVNRQDYHQLADVKLPIVRKGRGRVEESSSTSNKLYTLQILEEDQENGRVKVGYASYSDEFDEWKRVEEVMSVDDDE